MKAQNWSYLAGLFDGEGCIHIRRNAATEKTKHKSTHYSLILKVAMCHEQTIARLKDIFNCGHVTVSSQATDKKSKAWSWCCQSNDAALVLKLVHPYIFTKLEEVNLGLKFRELPTGRGGKKRVYQELLNSRESFYLQMRSLKGVSKYHHTRREGSRIDGTSELESSLNKSNLVGMG